MNGSNDSMERMEASRSDASLMLGGDMRAPIFGLEILITASDIYVVWHKMTAVSCRKKLKRLGVEIA
jgi:hypothetical protein